MAYHVAEDFAVAGRLHRQLVLVGQFAVVMHHAVVDDPSPARTVRVVVIVHLHVAVRRVAGVSHNRQGVFDHIDVGPVIGSELTGSLPVVKLVVLVDPGQPYGVTAASGFACQDDLLEGFKVRATPVLTDKAGYTTNDYCPTFPSSVYVLTLAGHIMHFVCRMH